MMVCGARPARFGWSGAGDDGEDWILSGARVYRVWEDTLGKPWR